MVGDRRNVECEKRAVGIFVLFCLNGIDIGISILEIRKISFECFLLASRLQVVSVVQPKRDKIFLPTTTK